MPTLVIGRLDASLDACPQNVLSDVLLESLELWELLMALSTHDCFRVGYGTVRAMAVVKLQRLLFNKLAATPQTLVCGSLPCKDLKHKGHNKNFVSQ